MKYIIVLVALTFSWGSFSQQVPLSGEEMNRLSDFEGNQIDFGYDEGWKTYVYTSLEFVKSSTNVLNPQVKVRAFLPLTLVDDTYCFGKIQYAVNLYRQGKGCAYDSVAVSIGFASNIKKGDAILYGFNVEADGSGNACISGDAVEEIIQKSIEMKRPINFYFYKEKQEVATIILPYAKVGQKFGGLIKTRNNLAQKYILCEE